MRKMAEKFKDLTNKLIFSGLKGSGVDISELIVDDPEYHNFMVSLKETLNLCYDELDMFEETRDNTNIIIKNMEKLNSRLRDIDTRIDGLEASIKKIEVAKTAKGN